MKKSFITKLFAVMTAASMLAGGAAVVAAEEKDPFAFDSVADVVFPLEEKLELDVFVYATNTGGGTFGTNYVTDYIEEKTNIKLNFVYDLDGDDAKTKLNLIMTDPSSMPDIFLATNWTKSELQSYGQQGLVLALDDYLKDAKMWNEMNEKCAPRLGDLTMSDGHIYNYGQTNECHNQRKG